MNRFQLASTLFTIWTLLLSTVSGAAEPLVVSGSPKAPPIVWEKSGTLTGIGPQLVASFLDQAGIKYTIRPEGSWAEVQAKAKSGAIDMIVSAYDNQERREYLDYSIPYIKSPVVIVVKKGDGFPLNSWNDLNEKKGVANTGESFGEKFDTFIREKLNVAFVPYESAFAMLADDRADYLIIDLYPSVIYAKMLNAEDKIEYLDNPATLQNFHVTIAKSSPYKSLVPKINAYIKQMQDRGEIKKMMQEQYQAWHKTFQERKRFFERSNIQSMQTQVEFDAGAYDRGLNNLMRFVETNKPYLSD
jgi:polar amino acid transport system substrate-binding protein